MQAHNLEPNRKGLIEDFFRHVVNGGKFSVLKDFITNLSIREKEDLLIGKGDLSSKLNSLEIHPYKILQAKLQELAPLTACSWDKPKTIQDLVVILKSNLTVKAFRQLDRNSQIQKINELKQNAQNEDEFLFDLISDDAVFNDCNQVRKLPQRPTKTSIEVFSKKNLSSSRPIEEILEQDSEQESSLIKDSQQEHNENNEDDQSNKDNEEEKKEASAKQSFNAYQSFDYELRPVSQHVKEESARNHQFFAKEMDSLQNIEESSIKEAFQLFEKGELLEKENEREKALEYFGQAIKLHPLPQILEKRAEILKSLKRYKEAIEDADQLLKILPNENLKKVFPFKLKIDIFINQKEYEEAEKTIDEFLKCYPDLLIVWEKKLLLFQEQGKHESLVEFADKAIEHFRNKGVVEIYRMKITSLVALNKFLLVEKECDKLIEIEKSKETDSTLFVYTCKGFALKMQGRMEEAKECLKKCIQVDPKKEEEVAVQFIILKSLEDFPPDRRKNSNSNSMSLGFNPSALP